MKTNGMILALALGIACMQSAPAQSFKKVKVAANTPLAQVASGGASVWALASNGNPYIFKGKSFALANSITLSQIAVGGGNSAQADAVWALDSSGSIYRASKSATTWSFTRVAGSLTAIAVGPGYQDACHPYEVWGLNSASQIYRYNFCGGAFDQVPGSLCEIQVGGGSVWGAECGHYAYRFNFSTGVFDQISFNPFYSIPALTVGPNGEVWAIDTGFSGETFRYEANENRFLQVNCCYSQIQAGGNGVFAISGINVYRWEPSTLGFVQVPGSLASLSVGSGGGVWGLDGAGKVYAFTVP